MKSVSFTHVSDTCLVTSKGVNPLSMLKSHKPPARGGSPVTEEDEALGMQGNLQRNSSFFFSRASASLVPSGKRFRRISGHTGWPPCQAKTCRSGAAAVPESPSTGRVPKVPHLAPQSLRDVTHKARLRSVHLFDKADVPPR